MAQTRTPRKHLPGLMLIAVFKFLKACALLLVGFGALHFLHRDLAATISHWVDLLRIDPHNHYLLWLMEKVTKVDETRLREFSVGTFFYAALFFTEGAGLALRKRWAEYLTIISTSSLLPLEVYELSHRPTIARFALLLVNLAVVAYLVFELRRTRVITQG
jgi:uncharacterized membrane protein (DUF2068 family)